MEKNIKKIYVNNIHDYDLYFEILKDGSKLYSLYYSDNICWNSSIKKTLAGQIKDNGDELILSKELIPNKRKINYTQSTQLTILLKIIDQGTLYQMSNIETLINF